MTCNHNWSEGTHEGVPSRFCHVCNEWEIEVEYDRALAEIERLNTLLLSVTGENQKRAEREARALEDWRELRAENDRLKASRLPDVEYARLDVMWQQMVRERDEARAKIERLRDERRMFRRRLAECLPWVGVVPYPNTPRFSEMIAVRDLADDALAEVPE